MNGKWRQGRDASGAFPHFMDGETVSTLPGSALQPRGLGEIDAEPVTPALIAPCHLGGGMAELFLDITLVDLGRGGEAGAQRMAGKQLYPFGLGQLAANAGGKNGLLDEAGDLLVLQPFGTDGLALAGDAAEQGAMADPAEFQSGFDRGDRASEIRGAAANLNLAPAGLAAQRHQHALVEDVDPAVSVLALVAAIEREAAAMCQRL